MRGFRWVVQWAHSTWGTVSHADVRVHQYLYTRWPKAIGVIGWTLRLLYAGCVAPAFAVMLALLLVGLVISGQVTFIVSISVFSAWLVAILSVAKSEWVNKQRIGRRFLIVLCAAGLLASLANRYVKWCLAGYARTQPKTSAQSDSNNNDRLAYERMKELFDQELRSLPVSPFPPTSPAEGNSEAKPDVSLALVHPTGPALMLNNTSVVARMSCIGLRYSTLREIATVIIQQ